MKRTNAKFINSKTTIPTENAMLQPIPLSRKKMIVTISTASPTVLCSVPESLSETGKEIRDSSIWDISDESIKEVTRSLTLVAHNYIPKDP